MNRTDSHRQSQDPGSCRHMWYVYGRECTCVCVWRLEIPKLPHNKILHCCRSEQQSKRYIRYFKGFAWGAKHVSQNGIISALGQKHLTQIKGSACVYRSNQHSWMGAEINVCLTTNSRKDMFWYAWISCVCAYKKQAPLKFDRLSICWKMAEIRSRIYCSRIMVFIFFWGNVPKK